MVNTTTEVTILPPCTYTPGFDENGEAIVIPLSDPEPGRDPADFHAEGGNAEHARIMMLEALAKAYVPVAAEQTDQQTVTTHPEHGVVLQVEVFTLDRISAEGHGCPLTNSPEYSHIKSCHQARGLNLACCPLHHNCVLPDGQPVSEPSQLIEWTKVPMKKVPQGVLAQHLADHVYPQGLLYALEAFYGYKAGVYQQLEQLPDIDRPLVNLLGIQATVALNKAIPTMLQYRTACHSDVFDSNPNLLCLNNGTLNLTTGELGPHSPTHMLLNKVEIDFTPGAECPKFLSFLASIFVNDMDKAEKIAFLRQWLGYLLIPDTSYQKMVWLVGAGGNGKSVLLQVVEWLVGSANISHAMLDRLDKAPVRAELIGKTVNISADLPKDAMINDGYMKAIVAGDMIEAEYKYKPSFSFKPYVRLMAAMNNLPKTNDSSDGFFRRVVIISFNRRFAESEQNPALANELREELPGILNWALVGLAELRAQNKFTIPSSSLEALATYRTESNPVHLFAEQCLIPAETGGFTATELFNVYKEWASDRGFRQIVITTFGRELANLGFTKRKSNSSEYWRVNWTAEGRSLTFVDQTVLDMPAAVAVIPEPVTVSGYTL